MFDPCRSGSPPLDFEVKRDEGFLRSELIPGCLAFWDAIQTAKGPQPDPERDLYLPASEEAAARWVQTAAAYRSLATERRDLETALKALKARMVEAESVFLGQMGEFLLAETAGVRVTRYLQNGSVDYPALLSTVLPDLDTEQLDRFRRPPSERIKVTLQDQPAGRRQPRPASTSDPTAQQPAGRAPLPNRGWRVSPLHWRHTP